MLPLQNIDFQYELFLLHSLILSVIYRLRVQEKELSIG